MSGEVRAGEIIRLGQFAATRFLERQSADWRRCHEEDVRAQASMEAWRYAQKFDPAYGMRLSTYVVKCVEGRLRNYLRDDARRNPPALSLDAAGRLVGPENVEQEVTDAAELRQRLAWIREQLPDLPLMERLAVQGMDFEGLSGLALARREGVPVGGVLAGHTRAVARLRALARMQERRERRLGAARREERG